MKITELDLKTEGKRYKCGNSMFVIKNGDLFDVEMYTYLKDSCIPIAELVEMEFKEVNQIKNPYERVNPGKNYYFVKGRGEVGCFGYLNCDIDNKQFNGLNHFNNRNYAEYIAFKETLMRKLDRFAWENNETVINWNDGSTKYYILFSHTDNRVIVDWDFMYMSNNIYFTSREIAEKAIKEFKDDLIKLYTWKFDF